MNSGKGFVSTFLGVVVLAGGALAVAQGVGTPAAEVDRVSARHALGNEILWVAPPRSGDIAQVKVSQHKLSGRPKLGYS